ncbi:hypothetical protein B0H14DRAFT_3556244 [Mycena olivaceomarginata]|nr:hypothetical protein B0H14DRAFT_3556244 [Mycena olivaceomarginata]
MADRPQAPVVATGGLLSVGTSVYQGKKETDAADFVGQKEPTERETSPTFPSTSASTPSPREHSAALRSGRDFTTRQHPTTTHKHERTTVEATSTVLFASCPRASSCTSDDVLPSIYLASPSLYLGDTYFSLTSTSTASLPAITDADTTQYTTPSPFDIHSFELTPTSTSEYIARSTKRMVDASTVDCNAKEDDEPGGEMCTDTTRTHFGLGPSSHTPTQRSPTIPSSSPLLLPFFFSPHFCSTSPHDRSPNLAPSASSDLAVAVHHRVEVLLRLDDGDGAVPPLQEGSDSEDEDDMPPLLECSETEDEDDSDRWPPLR